MLKKSLKAILCFLCLLVRQVKTDQSCEMKGAHHVIACLTCSLAGLDEGHEAKARSIFEDLQKGTIDRSLFTENANFYFNEQALQDFSASLADEAEQVIDPIQAMTLKRQADDMRRLHEMMASELTAPVSAAA